MTRLESLDRPTVTGSVPRGNSVPALGPDVMTRRVAVCVVAFSGPAGGSGAAFWRENCSVGAEAEAAGGCANAPAGTGAGGGVAKGTGAAAGASVDILRTRW